MPSRTAHLRVSSSSAQASFRNAGDRRADPANPQTGEPLCRWGRLGGPTFNFWRAVADMSSMTWVWLNALLGGAVVVGLVWALGDAIWHDETAWRHSEDVATSGQAVIADRLAA